MGAETETISILEGWMGSELTCPLSAEASTHDFPSRLSPMSSIDARSVFQSLGGNTSVSSPWQATEAWSGPVSGERSAPDGLLVSVKTLSTRCWTKACFCSGYCLHASLPRELPPDPLLSMGCCCRDLSAISLCCLCGRALALRPPPPGTNASDRGYAPVVLPLRM